MPNTGPIDGSRSATTLFSPSAAQGVGQARPRSSSCPRRPGVGRHRRDEDEVPVGPVLQASAGSASETLALVWPYGTRASAGMPSVVACQVDDGRDVGGLGDLDVGRERGGCVDVDAHTHHRGTTTRVRGPAICGHAARLWRARPRRRRAHGIPCSGAHPRRAPPRRGRRGRRHRAARPGRDGARRRRRDRRQGPPARPGRHGHRQVAGLPRARGAARDGLRHPDGRRHRDARAAGPDRRPRHAAPGRVRSRRCSAAARPTRSSRAAATTCAPTSSRAASPTTTTTP